MAIITTGLFTKQNLAYQAIAELQRNGFSTVPLTIEGNALAAWAISKKVVGKLTHKVVEVFKSLGMNENTARIFENRINRGHIMVAVVTDHWEAVRAANILERFDASDLARTAPT
jgi:hypothetical protein